MELSLFLAQMWGVTFMIVGTAMLLRPDVVTSILQDFKPHSFAGYFIGLVTLVLGLAMILTHNVWDGTWRTIITLFGWASFVKGGVYLFAPKVLERRAEKMARAKWVRAAFVAMIVVGAYLCYVGFGLGA